MPASQRQTFKTMAYNHAWANHRLLSACAELTQSELTAPRTGFFPSLQSTLNHTLIIDRFILMRSKAEHLGRPPGRIHSRTLPSRSYIPFRLLSTAG